MLALKPANVTYEQAAPVCGALAAWNALKDQAHLQPGQSVLINGASGVIGTAAVQIAAHLGAHVTGVCSTANLERVKALGADEVIDYTREDFTKTGRTYDVIFDVVSKRSFSRCKGSLTHNGVYIPSVPGLSILFQMWWTSRVGSKKAKFSATGLRPVPERLRLLNELIELVEAGKVKTVIDRCYPLEQIVEAHRYVEQGRKKGNVIITIEHHR